MRKFMVLRFIIVAFLWAASHIIGMENSADEQVSIGAQIAEVEKKNQLQIAQLTQELQKIKTDSIQAKSEKLLAIRNLNECKKKHDEVLQRVRGTFIRKKLNQSKNLRRNGLNWSNL